MDNDVNSMYPRVMTMTEQTFTWRVYLDLLQSKYASWMKLGQECEGDGLADATEMMQEKFPGPYRVVEGYDVDRGTFSLKLKFEDEREEIVWLLRNS